jgi:hypothetical protein
MHDTANQTVGRDPVGKTITEALHAAHPDWTDQQITDRINREYNNPVITLGEVADWRPEVQA